MKRTPVYTVRVLSIGQADSILLHDGTHTALIDTGEKDDGEDILEMLAEMGIQKLDLVILTHFDKDHIGGAPKVLAGIPVEHVMVPAYEPGSKPYRNLLSALSDAHTVPEIVSADKSLAIGTMEFEVWAPRAAYTDSDNDQSLVTRVSFGDIRLLLLGDAEDARTNELLSSAYDLSCDIIKIPHHGRFHETSAALLDAAAPEYAIITDSKKNPAEDDLLALLKSKKITIMRTRDGEALLSLNGERIDAKIIPE